jgi:hypothetical protein
LPRPPRDHRLALIDHLEAGMLNGAPGRGRILDQDVRERFAPDTLTR